MGKSSRDKGKRGQAEVVALLRGLQLWDNLRQGYQYRGAEQADVEGSPFWVEVKLEKKWPSIVGAIRQGMRDTDGRPIAVFTRKTARPGQPKEPWLVTMLFEDWETLCAAAFEEEE